MISTLDRYIIRELFGPFLFGVASFSAILAGSTVLFPLVNNGIQYGIPYLSLVEVFFYKLPFIVVFTFPMCMLLCTLMAFGRLNSDLEMLAFRAGGISYARLLTPVIIAGLLVSFVTIWLNESVVPRTEHYAANVMDFYKNKEAPTIKENINFTEMNNGEPIRIINVKEIHDGILQSLTVAELENGHLSRFIRAKSGQWKSSGGWEFFNGVMHQFYIDDPYRVTLIEFEKETIDISINPYDVTKRTKNIEEMTSSELKQKIVLQQKLGNNPIRDIVNYHIKFAVPFASLIFSILGVSIGFSHHRSSSSKSLGFSLVVILIYYILVTLGTGLGLLTIIPPFLSAWLPNIIIGLVGIFRLKLITNH